MPARAHIRAQAIAEDADHEAGRYARGEGITSISEVMECFAIN
jgi:hypothetical protein